MTDNPSQGVLREGLPQLPRRMRSLPIDMRGYPVPWFVAWIDGKPDFRIADNRKLTLALRRGCCWVCGEPVGRFKTFVIGPMCAVNRTTAEPPCHKECAVFSATACPFLKLPRAQRRDGNIPDNIQDPAGIMIPRNPGVTLLWTTLSFERWEVDNGLLFQIGQPIEVEWYSQSRRATRDEILRSIDSGMPLLRKIADREGKGANAQLQRQYDAMLALLPEAA